jgi:hypothetical protein
MWVYGSREASGTMAKWAVFSIILLNFGLIYAENGRKL